MTTRALRAVLIQRSDFTTCSLRCQSQRTDRFAIGGLSRVLWHMHQHDSFPSACKEIGSGTAVVSEALLAAAAASQKDKTSRGFNPPDRNGRDSCVRTSASKFGRCLLIIASKT